MFGGGQLYDEADDADASADAASFAIMLRKYSCHRLSSVSSGWNAVARSEPWRTATETVTALPSVLFAGGLVSWHSGTTPSPYERIAGARMKMPWNRGSPSPSSAPSFASPSPSLSPRLPASRASPCGSRSSSTGRQRSCDARSRRAHRSSAAPW